ncbi:MAG: glucoamylase family protein [Eubacteriales bacterium]|nr:glucoamylase family protein [Eubacteriales bacterium]
MPEGAGPQEWAAQMAGLSGKLTQVRWQKHNIVISHSKKIHNQMNAIREKIEEMPSDLLTLIPSARWLIDNFQMIYREIKKLNFSTTGKTPMPVLKNTQWKGLPRVYVIASLMIELSGGYLSEESAIHMLKAYQQADPLTDRELQALPEMAGLAMLEHILEVTREITAVADAKAAADLFVKEHFEPDQEFPDISSLLTQMGEREGDIYFHSHVLYLMRSLSLDQEMTRRYITYHFKDEWENTSAVDIFIEESRQESILESTIRNPIASLRELSEINEEAIFEELSAVERILSRDPAGVYPRMDSLSRGLYRREVEKMSIRYGIPETYIAESCVTLAEAGHPNLNQAHHVGAYLMGKGTGILRQTIRRKANIGAREPVKVKGFLYFFSLGGLTLLLYYLLWLVLARGGEGPEAVRFAAMALAAVPLVAGIAIKIANSFFTRSVPAKGLPAMDYKEGVPEHARTLVVMPVIISNKKQGLEYLNRLHKHYLANRQENLYFALLADYADADQQETPEDAGIREALIARTGELNAEYPDTLRKFSLLFRERRFNESEGCWMCWERKRGKLEEFNRLLSGVAQENTTFADVLADPELLIGARYVITLDADSDLVLDNASRLVGLIDHPLNRAVVDPEKKKVTDGYAIIQPQVMNHINDPGSSLFQRVYSGKTGLPNYSMAISDVYQDVFSAGTFVGKGIYNVRAFHQLLDNIIPENRVLSHDLLESCYARTAFTGNAHIVENFPGSFAAYAKRQHRWIRGDWQLLPWLFKRDLGPLSKWKIQDDLRASLVPLSKLLLVFLNLLFFQDAWWLWLAVLGLSPAIDLLAVGAELLVHWAQGRRYVLLYRKLFRELGLLFSQAVFDLVFIPFEAYYAMDAIFRTVYRYLVSKRNFLRWDTADQAEKTAADSPQRYFARMWPTLPIALALILALAGMPLPPVGRVVYALAAALWGMSFFIAYLISRQGKDDWEPGPEANRVLGETARRTWRFFRIFTTPENNMLCPDNYQLGRKQQLTHKTSPTNIGLQLLSALSAWDLGLETMISAIAYIEPVLKTVMNLPTWQGHLYNWYDTRSLELLSPHYVSTVDSGNFLGYLLTLKNGILEMREASIVSRRVLGELGALLRIMNAEVALQGDYTRYSDLAEDLASVQAALEQRNDLMPTPEMQDFTRLAAAIREDIDRLGLHDRAMVERVTLEDLSREGHTAARTLLGGITALANTIDKIVDAADFRSLYNPKRKLFYIGYNATSQTYDNSCYDLIASESMLTSLLAIAKGHVPVRHWQRLGRPLTIIKGRPAHVSWSGTMFEYLMNHLIIREFRDSVFEDSSHAAVIQQMRYAKGFGIPWGMSESQYYRFDVHQNYQYKAFGVPKLRLQPVYRDMQVVSPYSTMLALEYAGDKAIANLKSLQEHGAFGKFGFYEAIDFTVPDPVTLKDYCIVRSFMAHHQGMSLAAIDNYLNRGVMRRRFHETPIIKAAQALLEEKHQSLFATPSRRGYAIQFKKRDIAEDESSNIRYIKSTNLPVPSANYMSNGSYSMLVTSDGDGFSVWQDTMLYRWRPDTFADTGHYVYIRDSGLNAYWSASFHPTRVKPDKYQVIFSAHQAEFLRQDKGISTSMTVSMAPDDSMEIRRVKLKNMSARTRELEVTSFLETALDTLSAESSHPAFSKLFIESEFLPERRALLSRRRGGQEQGPYALHMLRADARIEETLSHETSRIRFVGRNNTLRSPQAIRNGIPLSNSADFSSDPIMSLQVRLSLKAGEEAVVTFFSGLYQDHEQALTACDMFSIPHRSEDAMERFRQQNRIELKYLDMTGSQYRAFQNIIRQVYYPFKHYRGPAENIRRNWSGQSGLWRFGISGDNPIMLLLVRSTDDVGLVRDVLKIYEYMGINLVRTDLVILAEGKYGYMSELAEMLTGMTSTLRIYDSAREKSGIYYLHSYELSPSDTDLLYTVASVVFSSETGIYFRKSHIAR